MLRYRTKRRSRLTPMRTMASPNLYGSGNRNKLESDKVKAALKGSTFHDSSAPPVLKGSAANVPGEGFKAPAERPAKIQHSDHEPSGSRLFDLPLNVLVSDMIVRPSSSIAPLRIIQWDEGRHGFVKTTGNNEKLQKDLRVAFGALQDLKIQRVMSRNPDYSVEIWEGDDEGSEMAINKCEWAEEEEDSDEARNKREAQEALLMLSGSRDLKEITALIFHDDHNEPSTSTGSQSKVDQ